MKNCLALSAKAFATHEIINSSGKVEGKQNCKLLHEPKRCRKLFRSFSHLAKEKAFQFAADGGFALWIFHEERAGGKHEIMYRDKLSSCCYRYPRILKIYRRLLASVSQPSLLIHQHSNPFNLIYGL